MRYVLLIFMLPVFCSCSSESSNEVDATYQRQIDDFDRQTAETDRHLKRIQAQQDETERQLERAKQQADRVDALLDRWEHQAERQDRIFERLDRLISPRPEEPDGTTVNPE
jgi:septal ring factor EnvC (AmiA/AmiB activator)